MSRARPRTSGWTRTGIEKEVRKATSGTQPLVMVIEYLDIDRERTLRVVEPYSYRQRGKYGRKHLYAWDLEAGGIRSFYMSSIHGARSTDRPFVPRFEVELGKTFPQADRKPVTKLHPGTLQSLKSRFGPKGYSSRKALSVTDLNETARDDIRNALEQDDESDFSIKVKHLKSYTKGASYALRACVAAYWSGNLNVQDPTKGVTSARLEELMGQIEELLDLGADPNFKGIRNDQKHMATLAYKDPELMGLLFEHGARITEEEAVHIISMTTEHGKIAKIILSFQPEHGPAIIRHALGTRNIEMIESLVRTGLISGETLTNGAWSLIGDSKSDKIIVDLISNGMMPIGSEVEGNLTMLHKAARLGRFPVVDALLKAGADPNMRDDDGKTPLHMMARWGAGNDPWKSITRALLKAGADPLAKDNTGTTPIHGTEGDVQELIKKAISKISSDAISKGDIMFIEDSQDVTEGRLRHRLRHTW